MSFVNRDTLIREIMQRTGVPQSSRQQVKARLETMSQDELWSMSEELSVGELDYGPRAKPQGWTAPATQAPKAKTQKAKTQKPKASRKSRKAVPQTLARRAARISRAIASKKVKAKDRIRKPADIKSATSRRQQVEKFVKMYKGVRITSRKSRSSR